MRRTLLPVALACACVPEQEITYTAAIYGEEFIEEGIPAAEFVDGWAVQFDHFLVSVGEVTVADAPLNDRATQFQVFDLAKPSDGAGFPVGRGTYSLSDAHVGYVIGPSADAIAGLAGNVDAADVDLMKQGGYSVHVVGSATRGEDSVTFTWGFTTRTVYGDCEPGGTDAQLTIHGDHLFYDDLFSEAPDVAFDLIAGAAGGDGDVSPEDLRAVDITAEERYQVGDLTDITDLWAFIEQQTASLGHINGEGHCEAARES